jgi:hypothetical protein
LKNDQLTLKMRHDDNKYLGFARVDLLVISVMVCVVFFLMHCTGERYNLKKERCLAKLKYLGNSFETWSFDHNYLLPFAVPTNEGGTMEFCIPEMTYKHFQVLSNYLLSTDILRCPSEYFPRWPADDLQTMSDTNVSYFININAKAREKVTTILSGDRNIKGGKSATQGGILFKSDSSAFWDKNLHGRNGNFLLTDGSVTNVNNAALNRTFRNFVKNEMHLLIP